MERQTRYGKLMTGNSKYVIVAPHGVQCDDKNTARIAELVSQQLNASAVINTGYARDEQDITNFNNIKKYHPVKNEFYKDISDLVRDAEKADGSCVVVYIHGMINRGEGVGIDIGCGLKEYSGQLLSTKQHPNAGDNTGKRRANKEQVTALKVALEERLNDEGLTATIGRYFPAWSTENGVQYHAGQKNVASMQLEINATLRERPPEYIARMIAEALKQVYR